MLKSTVWVAAFVNIIEVELIIGKAKHNFFNLLDICAARFFENIRDTYRRCFHGVLKTYNYQLLKW